MKLETEQDITFRINHSDAVMVLASDQQIAKLRPMKEKLPSVKRYILLDPAEAARIIAGEITAYMKGGKYDGHFPYRWIPSAFAVIEEPFSEKNGMVNSTMKIVKHKVYEKYAGEIALLHTPEGKRSDSAYNLEVLSKLLS